MTAAASRRRRSTLLRQAALLAFALAAARGAAAAEPLDRGLRLPGAAERFTIKGGERHAHRVQLDPKHRYRVVVVEDGADLAISLEPGGVEHDTLSHGAGRETLALAPDTARIVLRSVEGGSHGAYAIELQRLDPAGPRALEAQRLSDAASRAAAAANDLAGRERAIEAFARAARAWAGARRADDRAHELFAQCELERRIGKRAEAVAHCEQARGVWRALADHRFEARVTGYLGLIYAELGRSADAKAAHELALEKFALAQDDRGRATASVNLGLLLHHQGQLDAALAHYQTALEINRRLDQRSAIATLHNNIGGIHFMRGEARASALEFELAIGIQRAIGNREGEASALGNLALLQRLLGDLRASLTTQTEVLEIRRSLSDREGEARALHNIGLVYLVLGDPERAHGFLVHSLRLRREVGDRVGEIATLRHLGMASAALDDHVAALVNLENSATLARQAMLRDSVASASAARGQVLLSAGREDEARVDFAEAAAEFQKLGMMRQHADALLGDARALLALGESGSAEEVARRALDALGDNSYVPIQARANLVLAQAAYRAGRHAEAASSLETALALIESMRGRIGTPDLRASYGATVRDGYEFAVELAVATGESGVSKSLELAEWTRARTFNELLGELDLSRVGTAGPAASLRQQFELLSAELSARSAAYLEGREPADAALVRAELDVVEAELRAKDPAFADLRAPQRLTASEIRTVLDEDTALLEYMVGERVSYLWVVTRESMHVHELPSRAILNRLVRRVTDSWSRRVQGMDTSSDAVRLAELVLPRSALGGLPIRLAIVADGPLEFLPFAALSVDDARRLIESHEIVMLPSASALATQRKVLSGRKPAPHALAIVADPVFDRDDARAPPCAVTGCDPIPKPRLPRLLGAAAEAQALRELRGIDNLRDGFVATGISATRGAVISGALAGHRTVHIATHGLLDARQPLRTGLMFSRVGAGGEAIDGFLGLRDVAGLRLDADLVVLSACETALGKEIRGEGLVGLTRGFMHAGARSVMATLWRVSDAGSVEAMRRFYRAYLRDGMSASAALRRAQLELRRDRRYADPYHWAAFTLHGDWSAR